MRATIMDAAAHVVHAAAEAKLAALSAGLPPAEACNAAIHAADMLRLALPQHVAERVKIHIAGYDDSGPPVLYS